MKGRYHLPAEWEPHAATWIAWPHEAEDWPGKLEVVNWVYAEIVRLLADSEQVQILVRDAEQQTQAAAYLRQTRANLAACHFHLCPTDRSWLRDSGPIGVLSGGAEIVWLKFAFNAWAKYQNYLKDRLVPDCVARASGLALQQVQRPDNRGLLTLEGGAFDSNGAGMLLVTEECLLSAVQQRNPGLEKKDYEAVFAEYFAVSQTIWLKSGCVGDDTHGHIDDVARFVKPGSVIAAWEDDTRDENHEPLRQNLEILSSVRNRKGEPLKVVKIPMPRAIYFDDQRLPASYLNFYISNRVVLVPTFNDPNDRVALNILQSLWPERQVCGVYCRDLVLGLGTLHCLTQQQPAL